MSSYKKVSLSEINQSIETPNNNHFWQNLKAFLGPGAFVSVGYFFILKTCLEPICIYIIKLANKK